MHLDFIIAPVARRSSSGERLSSVFQTVCRQPVLVFCGLLLAVLGAYLPSLDGQFLWDDQALVLDNFLIRSPLFCVEAFRHTLFGGTSNFFRPTQTLVFIADYWFWGFQSYGYHLTSILIHGANGFLLYLLLRRILPGLCPGLAASGGGAAVPAFTLAAVWALHPVHSAAVAYVSGSADSLAMLFCLGAWLLAEQSFEAQGTSRAVWLRAGGAVGFFFGLCSKEIAFVWLALFVGYTLFFKGRRTGGNRTLRLTIAGGCVVVGVYAFLRHGVSVPASRNNLLEHSAAIMALRALGDYGSLLVFPSRLLMERQVYPTPKTILTAEDHLFYSSLTAGGLLLVSILAAGCWWRGEGRKLRIFGVAWFVCGFLPVSNLFVTINAAVAEHWLYLPSIGLLLFAAGCLAEVRRRPRRVAALACALVFALALGVRTYWRSFDWMDEMTFFRQTIVAGGDLPRARMGMANAFSHRQDDRVALGLLRRIAADAPGYVSNQINLGLTLLRVGQLEEGRTILEQAFSQCDAQEARTVLIVIGNLDKLENSPVWLVLRETALIRLRQRYPDAWEIVDFDASRIARAGDSTGALATLNRYAKAHWWHYPSHFALGRLLTEVGRGDEAKLALAEASRLDVHDADALAVAAEIDARSGHLAEAQVLQSRAVARQPASPKQRLLLGAIFTALGQTTQAAEQSEAARSLLSRSTPAASR